MYEIVTLSRFPDIFEQFQESVFAHEPNTHCTVVLDYKTRDLYDRIAILKWQIISGIDPFIFARNANLGLRAAGRRDVILVNDDVSFLRHESLKDLEKDAYSSPDIGIVSPIIRGIVGNPYQREYCNVRPKGISTSPKRLAFVCVYIKRSTIDTVGYLDEQFDGYGGDDDDYCYRVEQAGLKLAVTTKVRVRHGFGYSSSSSSFSRTMKTTDTSMLEMRKKFIAKHGVPPKY